jgi:hypothetical protein
MRAEDHPKLTENEQMLKTMEFFVTNLYKSNYTTIGRWIFRKN